MGNEEREGRGMEEEGEGKRMGRTAKGELGRKGKVKGERGEKGEEREKELNHGFVTADGRR